MEGAAMTGTRHSSFFLAIIGGLYGLCFEVYVSSPHKGPDSVSEVVRSLDFWYNEYASVMILCDTNMIGSTISR